MPPRRAQRHRNVNALYGREEADEMEQRINESFTEKLNDGIGRLERMMLEMNQNRRRVSPESSHGRSRVSTHSDRETREDHDRRSVDNRGRNEDRRSGSRDVGGRDRHRYTSDFDEEFDGDRGSVHYRDRDPT